MAQYDSSKIRRQIGFFKKHIERTCSSIHNTLAKYEVDIKHPNLPHLDDDQLESLRLDLQMLRSSLLKAYEKMAALHEEWATMQQLYSQEAEIFDNYVTRYGDFRTSVQQAVTNSEDLDLLLNEVDTEFHKRDIAISSDASNLTNPEEQPNVKAHARDGTRDSSNPSAPVTNRSYPSHLVRAAAFTHDQHTAPQRAPSTRPRYTTQRCASQLRRRIDTKQNGAAHL
ncbi:unnamed protein product [Heligmosomoides polygyrus]|uniref:AH domain-containing protein n=1 Tax=Heligmosomoides polygyrus TaxID=6339 RepID=A0A183G4M4_HELPZ|nr:unnamed protein product [Heligmosomoides polygyrus]